MNQWIISRWVLPHKMVDFPASHVSFPEGMQKGFSQRGRPQINHFLGAEHMVVCGYYHQWLLSEMRNA